MCEEISVRYHTLMAFDSIEKDSRLIVQSIRISIYCCLYIEQQFWDVTAAFKHLLLLNWTSAWASLELQEDLGLDLVPGKAHTCHAELQHI